MTAASDDFAGACAAFGTVAGFGTFSTFGATLATAGRAFAAFIAGLSFLIVVFLVAVFVAVFTVFFTVFALLAGFFGLAAARGVALTGFRAVLERLALGAAVLDGALVVLAVLAGFAADLAGLRAAFLTGFAADFAGLRAAGAFLVAAFFVRLGAFTFLVMGLFAINFAPAQRIGPIRRRTHTVHRGVKLSYQWLRSGVLNV